MERDLLLMCRNACHFNEPGSWIYKDAKLLKKIITAAAKKQNVEVAGPVLKSMSAALSTRSKRGNRSTHALIAQSAALRDEDEESDDEEEDPLDTEESDNPQWQLFQTIRTAPNSQGIF
jgi:protein polybromo-1